MWWWHQQCTSNMPQSTKHHVSTVLALKRSTDNILGSGHIRYITDAYQICCMGFSIYFFSVGTESYETRAWACLLQVQLFKILILRLPWTSSRSMLFVQSILLIPQGSGLNVEPSNLDVYSPTVPASYDNYWLVTKCTTTLSTTSIISGYYGVYLS